MKRDIDDINAALAEATDVDSEPTFCEPPARVEQAEPSTNGKSKKSKKKEGGGLVKKLADTITEDRHFAVDEGMKVYHYSHGVYKPRGERLIKAQVKDLCVEWQRTDEWSRRLSDEVTEFIRVDAPKLWESPPIDKLNLKNGIYDTKAGKLLPHDPTHLSPIQLDIEYRPDATCPAIDKYVSEWFPEDTIPLAYEIAAWLMLPITSIQKAILLLGAGGNGKSAFLAMVMAFIGKRNVSTLPLHKLESDRFAPARLFGKLANVCPDLPTDHLAGTSVFKAITGGDYLTGERKFAESFDFTPFARLVFSANSPPRSQDSSDGFFDRWLVVPFGGTFRGTGQEIPRAELDALLSSSGEQSGLLNKALKALSDIQGRGWRLHESESTKEAHREFQATTDPLAVWLDGNTIEDPMAVVPKDVLRAAYGAACERSGRPTLTKTAFGLAFKKLKPDVDTKQRTLNERLQWCYIGLGMTSGDSQTSQTSQGSPTLTYRTCEGEEDIGGEEIKSGNPVNLVNPVSDEDFEPPLDIPDDWK